MELRKELLILQNNVFQDIIIQKELLDSEKNENNSLLEKKIVFKINIQNSLNEEVKKIQIERDSLKIQYESENSELQNEIETAHKNEEDIKNRLNVF